MDQWEYLPTFIEANASKKEVKEFLKEAIPDLGKPPRYMPEAMMPQLDEFGAQGWELIHMQPVRAIGKKRDVLFESFGRRWSHVYFCVFKRKKITDSFNAQAIQPPTIPPTYESLPTDIEETNLMDALPHDPLDPSSGQ
jgi:hypothetical protein